MPSFEKAGSCANHTYTRLSLVVYKALGMIMCQASDTPKGITILLRHTYKDVHPPLARLWECPSSFRMLKQMTTPSFAHLMECPSSLSTPKRMTILFWARLKECSSSLGNAQGNDHILYWHIYENDHPSLSMFTGMTILPWHAKKMTILLWVRPSKWPSSIGHA